MQTCRVLVDTLDRLWTHRPKCRVNVLRRNASGRINLFARSSWRWREVLILNEYCDVSSALIGYAVGFNNEINLRRTACAVWFKGGSMTMVWLNSSRSSYWVCTVGLRVFVDTNSQVFLIRIVGSSPYVLRLLLRYRGLTHK